MDYKTYGMTATPSFLSSEKLYGFRAFPKTSYKVYGFSLNVASPFMETEKDYPVRTPVSSRYPGVIEGDASQVGDRVVEVSASIMQYQEVGRRREDRIAVPVEEILAETIREIHLAIREELDEVNLRRAESIVKIMELDDFMRNIIVDIAMRKFDVISEYIRPTRSIQINEYFSTRTHIVELPIDIIEDREAMRVLRILHGSDFVDYLNEEVVRKEKEIRFNQFAFADLLGDIYDTYQESFDEFEVLYMPVYLHELDWGMPVPIQVSALDPGYQLALNPNLTFDAFGYDIESGEKVFYEHLTHVHTEIDEADVYRYTRYGVDSSIFDLGDRAVETFDTPWQPEYHFGDVKERIFEQSHLPLYLVDRVVEELVSWFTPLDAGSVSRQPIITRFEGDYRADRSIETRNTYLDAPHLFDRYQETWIGSMPEYLEGGYRSTVYESAFIEPHLAEPIQREWDGSYYEEFIEAGSLYLDVYLPEFDEAIRLSRTSGSVIIESDLADTNVLEYEADILKLQEAGLSTEEVNAVIALADMFNRVEYYPFLADIEFMDEFERQEVVPEVTIQDAFDFLRNDDRTVIEIIQDFDFTRNDDRTVLDIIESDPVQNDTRPTEADIMESSPITDISTDYETEIIQSDGFDFFINEYQTDILSSYDFAVDGKAYEIDVITGEPFARYNHTHESFVDESAPFSPREKLYDGGMRDEFNEFLSPAIPTYLHELEDFLKRREIFDVGLTEQELFDLDRLFDTELGEKDISTIIRRLQDTIIETTEEVDRSSDTWLSDIEGVFDFDWIRPERDGSLGEMEQEFEGVGRDTDIIEFDPFDRHRPGIPTYVDEFDEFIRDREYETSTPEIDWFTRVIQDISIEELDWFTRTIVDIEIEELDWFTRIPVPVKIIEDTPFVRDMTWDSDLEDDFIPVSPPEEEEYTWLWHSRPYWWFGWNFKKTK